MSEKSKKSAGDGTSQNNADQKLPYKEPTMTAVSLFADQVLGGGCLKIAASPCDITPPLVIS